jgi:hypothetical protein
MFLISPAVAPRRSASVAIPKRGTGYVLRLTEYLRAWARYWHSVVWESVAPIGVALRVPVSYSPRSCWTELIPSQPAKAPAALLAPNILSILQMSSPEQCSVKPDGTIRSCINENTRHSLLWHDDCAHHHSPVTPDPHQTCLALCLCRARILQIDRQRDWGVASLILNGQG